MNAETPHPPLRVSIAGGSGYTGGELLRLLGAHPQVALHQVTSRRHAGKFIHTAHPHLRGRLALTFSAPQQLQPCDVLFLALPHGEAAQAIDRFAALAPRLVDLSADFRLRDPQQYERWYGRPHPAPHWLPRFAYGLPELFRPQITAARHVSGVGCNATAVNLALAPLARRGLIRRSVVDLKVGSSEAGATPSPSSHHPERSGVMRSFALTGHRHHAEVEQALGPLELHWTVTSVESVRGVLCTAHVFTEPRVDDRELWKIYRDAYRSEPFVRLVNDRHGLHRFPEPKWLAGANYCDIGFAADPDSDRVVVVSALDNLVKGAAGSAVQCLNLMLGVPETTALEFSGLHP